MTPTNHPAPESEREAIKQAIREYCNRQSAGSCVISSDLIERIYYAGLSLDGLADAILSRRGEPVAWRKALENLIRFIEEANQYELQHPYEYSAYLNAKAALASPPAPVLDALEAELEELASNFEGAGPDAPWTGRQIADHIRRRIGYRK
jgi:hypothetical protein